MSEEAREVLLDLMREKDAMEAKIMNMKAKLQLSIEASLVDDDGFPRDDVDVYNERHNRYDYICLQNDHKAIMHKIEIALQNMHALQQKETPKEESSSKKTILLETKEEQQTNTTTSNNNNQHNTNTVVVKSSNEEDIIPFFKVGQVSQGSPASEAGMHINDQILRFGSITCHNVSTQAMKDEVLKNKNKSIKVEIVRNHLGVLVLDLCPREWNGKGLLGCALLDI